MRLFIAIVAPATPISLANPSGYHPSGMAATLTSRYLAGSEDTRAWDEPSAYWGHVDDAATLHHKTSPQEVSPTALQDYLLCPRPVTRPPDIAASLLDALDRLKVAASTSRAVWLLATREIGRKLGIYPGAEPDHVTPTASLPWTSARLVLEHRERGMFAVSKWFNGRLVTLKFWRCTFENVDRAKLKWASTTAEAALTSGNVVLMTAMAHQMHEYMADLGVDTEGWE